MKRRRNYEDSPTRSQSDEPATEARRSSSLAENIVYGFNPVLELLRRGEPQIDQIIIADGVRSERIGQVLQLARSNGVPVHRVPKPSVDRSLPGVSHQGIFARTAVAKYRDADDLIGVLAAQVTTDRKPLVVGLDGIEDPRNLGAVLRTAECAGVDGVFIPERRAAGLTGTVAKAAAGALSYVPVARVTNLVQLIEQLKQRNIWVIGAASDSDTDYTSWDFTVPTAIFLGGEGSGLHRLVKERCDALVRIPLLGRIESLNVSVAAGVILYEALRQRRSQPQ